MLTLLFLLAVARIHASTVSMEAKIRDDADLSQFYQLLEASQVANTTLAYRHVTVFAPTNRAFQKYNEGSTKNLVLYHMSNQPLKMADLRGSISSELEGNPVLWITRISSKDRIPYSPDKIFINNAQILPAQSDFQSRLKVSDGEKIQVLHVIDEVLEPVRFTNPEWAVYNPNAFEFLNQSENINLGDHRVRTFRQRVTLTKKETVFKAEGHFTFFIPVDEGFKPEPRPEKIDHVVIDGHVVSDKVLFTAPTPHDESYPTLVFSDNLRVTVSIQKENNKVYVKSNTVVGDSTHPIGAVIAEIVKANIPVRNGVVHLIQRPLMVIDSTVKDFLESFKEKEDGPVYKFYEIIRDHGEDIMNTINHLRDVTLFAPNNAALEQPSVKPILQDKKRIKEILKLHFVKERLPLDKIKDKTGSQSVASAAERKKLYFNVMQAPQVNQVVTVEGGGVNATIITPNIAATNGFVHIIDRVLGVPYTTVLDKLKSDPMLNTTYVLGQQRGFNDQLNDTTKRFTYFAPREQAWETAKHEYPSTTKKLLMPEFSYHTKQILERHLVIADQAFTMAKLKEMSNDTILLPSVRDTLKLRLKEYNEIYHVEWQGKWIRVSRPDVECTNGIIHVIDEAFVKDGDVRVTGGASLATVAPHLIMLLIVKWHL